MVFTVFIVKTTVESSGAVNESTGPFNAAKAEPVRPGVFLSKLNVNTTSFAVKGWPSDHLTPGCSLKVRVKKSGLHV